MSRPPPERSRREGFVDLALLDTIPSAIAAWWHNLYFTPPLMDEYAVYHKEVK